MLYYNIKLINKKELIMHICSNCGKEFDGKFCPECGEKFVDKNACPKCGSPVKPDEKFCTECGARLDGKKNCPQCGALMESNSAFCSECGTKFGTGKVQSVNGGATTSEKVKFGLYLSGIICVLLSAFMGLVFAFVTGYAPKSGTTIGDGVMLYRFFGEAYKDIETAIDNIKTALNFSSIGSAREFGVYFPVVLGTVISAVGLLGVVALSALTAVNAYRKFCKKKKVNVIAPAVATYLTFATLATLLLVLVGMGSGKNVISFSAPTLAGLIVGGVFCGAGLLLIAGSNYEKFAKSDTIIRTALAFAVSVLLVVVITLMALPILEVTDGSNGGAFSPFLWLSGMLTEIQEDEKFYEFLAYAIISGLFAIAVTVITAVCLFRKVPAISYGKNKSNIVLGAVNVGCAIVLLAFVVVLGNMVIDISVESGNADVGELSLYLAVPIVILVMSVLSFGVELAGKFVPKGKAPVAVEEAQAE